MACAINDPMKKAYKDWILNPSDNSLNSLKESVTTYVIDSDEYLTALTGNKEEIYDFFEGLLRGKKYEEGYWKGWKEGQLDRDRKGMR